MKQRLIRPIALGLSLIGLTVFSVNELNKENKELGYNSEEISLQRKQHMEYLNNSPFKNFQDLSKKERKQLRLPPNKYYDQMWELSMNPATGKPEPEKVIALREELHKKRAQRAPGDNVNNPWIERGPNNVGGRTRALLFDPNDATNRRVYSGSVSGGLWVNNDITNANSQWTRVDGVPGNLNVTTITVDPRNNNNWYLGTGEQHSFNDVIGSGVYRSTNGGTTWQAVNIPPAGGGDFNQNNNLFISGINFVNDIIAWNNTRLNRTELFVGVGALLHNAGNPSNPIGTQSAGIYRSIDNGVNWNRIESANLRFRDNNRNYFYIPSDFEIGADNRLWMGTVDNINIDGNQGGRIFSSTDGGTWTEAGISPLANVDRVELEASATDRNKLYALVEGTTNVTPVSILRTSDAFATAANRTITSLPNDADTGISANDFTRGQAFYNLMIEANPANDDILYVGGIDLFRSTNSGDNWTQISKWSNENNLAGLNVPSVHADQHAMVFRPGNNNQAIFGNDGGVYYASSLSTAQNNTNVIQARNSGYNVTQFVKAAIGPAETGSQNIIFTAGAQDNGTQMFRNNVAGINSSEEIGFGDGFNTFIDRDGEHLILTNFRGFATRFDLPWNGVGQAGNGGTQLFGDSRIGDFVNQMGYDSEANFLLINATPVGTSNFAIGTIDVTNNNRDGATITNVLLTAKPTAFVPSPFADGDNNLNNDADGNNTWLVGLANGNLIELTNVARGAANWRNINTPFIGSISSIRYGATANDIMVTMHNYGVTSIWSTTNGGVNWVNKEGNLPDMPVRDILQNPLDRTEVIIATLLGVWKTNNFNAANPNWVRSQNGMSDVSVTSFDYFEINNENTIIASTFGRGVFTGSFTANAVADNQAPTAPTNLTSSNITQTSVNLSWTASQDNVAVTGYDVLRNGEVIRQNLNATNFQVTGLASGSDFTFNVRAKDAANNISSNSNTLNVRTLEDQVGTTYCAAGNRGSNFIAEVIFGSISNTSQNSAYTNFTAQSTNVQRGESVTLTVTPGITSSNWNSNVVGGWIDWNQDGDFNDSGEQVLMKPRGTGGGSANVVVPNDATEGSTRLRVRYRWSSDPSPCGATQGDEVEDYTVTVQNNDNTVVNPVDPTPAVTYCDTSGNPRDEFISNVSLGTINNASTGGTNGYSDFTTISTNLSKGVQSTITITPSWRSTRFAERYAVWIDYNRDGDFTDPGEQVVNQSSTRDDIINGNFTVPNSASDGTTRMRVMMSGNNITSSCGNISFGEIEDYAVTISGSAGAIANNKSEADLTQSIDLFPNPVRKDGNMNIKFAKQTNVSTYRIYNIVGIKVKEGVLKTSTLNVQELRAGNYFMEVLDGNQKMIKRFLKE